MTETFEAAATAIAAGDAAALADLLAADPDLAKTTHHRDSTLTLLHHVGGNGVAPEYEEVAPNAPDLVDILIAAGADPDATAEAFGGEDGSTPLTAVVTSALAGYANVQIPLLEALVRGGASIDGPNASGWPLAAATSFGYLPTARAVVDAGAATTNLLAAAAAGRTDHAIEAFGREDHGCPPRPEAWHGPVLQLLESPEGLGTAALGIAAMFGHTDTVEALLGAGAEPNHRQRNSTLALHHAAWGGDVASIEILLANGADPFARDSTWGLDAGGWAGYRGNCDAIAAIAAFVGG